MQEDFFNWHKTIIKILGAKAEGWHLLTFSLLLPWQILNQAI